ncbi:MAG: hypothetical protein K8S16_19680 [Bacteroidales bacterium]|nr:hypothetical protein [Bacteroidales bacterium]
MPDDSGIKKKKKKNDKFPIEITDRSGVRYNYTPPSSATAIFIKISDKFVENQYMPLVEEQLTDDYITKMDLDLYVKLNYLVRTAVSSEIDAYMLTDKGRNALEWNREFRKKWQKEHSE